MKLWLLRPISGRPEWNPWFDKAFGFVVRAETEKQARELVFHADDAPGDEGLEAWRNPEATTCIELLVDGDAEVIMRDFASA